jgi:hypothetical protein
MTLRYSFLALLIFTFMPSHTHDAYRRVSQTSFGTGEHLEYRVHYGMFNAAEASVDVSPQVQYINGRPCYKINVVGTTLGAFSWFAKIRDQWQSWLDTSAIVTQKFYRNIKENDYKKIETTLFDHTANTATVTDENGTKTYTVANNIQDAISGYFFLRTVEFDKLKAGDLIEMPTFFENKVYKMKVKYRGKDSIKTKFGKIKTLRMTPVMPDNQLFKGENSIRIWVSDDANRVPVKVEVDLWVGALVMELRTYQGARNAVSW